MFLQREDPLIPVIYEQMNSFLIKLASKFLPVSAIKAVNGDFFSLAYREKDDQLSGELVFIIMHVQSRLYIYLF